MGSFRGILLVCVIKQFRMDKDFEQTLYQAMWIGKRVAPFRVQFKTCVSCQVEILLPASIFYSCAIIIGLLFVQLLFESGYCFIELSMLIGYYS